MQSWSVSANSLHNVRLCRWGRDGSPAALRRAAELAKKSGSRHSALDSSSRPIETPREKSPAERIAETNDRLRRNLFAPHADGRVVMTRGVANSPRVNEILIAVSALSEFEEGNDPYGERDFGAFEVGGDRYFFKIDYYADSSMTYGAEDPAESCYRVLTVMRADEY